MSLTREALPRASRSRIYRQRLSFPVNPCMTCDCNTKIGRGPTSPDAGWYSIMFSHQSPLRAEALLRLGRRRRRVIRRHSTSASLNHRLMAGMPPASATPAESFRRDERVPNPSGIGHSCPPGPRWQAPGGQECPRSDNVSCARASANTKTELAPGCGLANIGGSRRGTVFTNLNLI